MAKAGRKPGSLVRGCCCVCRSVEMTRGAGLHFRCASCKAQGLRNPKAASSWNGKEEAGQQVARAIREGRMKHPTCFRCVDCGAPAIEYEHRDYNKPLEVEPICRRCNLRRGPAIPVLGSIERLVQKGRAPYRLRLSAKRLLLSMGKPVEILDDMPAKLEAEHWQTILSAFKASEASHG